MKNLILSLAFLLFGSVSAFATNKESVVKETFQKRVELVSDVKSSSVASVIVDTPVKQQVLDVVKSEDCDCTVIIIIIIIVVPEAVF